MLKKQDEILESNSGTVNMTNKQNDNNNVINNRSIFFYYTGLKKLSDLHITCSLSEISCIIIMGQPLHGLGGIEILQDLSELWIVECKLEKIDAICTCQKLKKLYLYSNKITSIPDLRKIEGLEILWLSKNLIHKVPSEFLPVALCELNLAENNITSIPFSSLNNGKLTTLNLSGNPITTFNVLISLRDLHSLRSLMFSDPMYNSSPICYLSNYRSLIIYSMLQLNSLDHILVTKDERKLAQIYYEDILFYYRVNKARKVIEFYNNYLKSTINYNLELDSIRTDIFNTMMKEKTEMVGKQEQAERNYKTITISESKKKSFHGKTKRLMERKSSEMTMNGLRLNSELKKLDIEIRNIGKFVFKNYERNSSLGNICQKLLNEFMCCYVLRDLNVMSVELINVTYVTPIGHPPISCKTEALQFYIMVCPISIDSITITPFMFIDQLMNDSFAGQATLLTLSDCLVIADIKLNWLLSTEVVSERRLALVVYIKKSATLLSSSNFTCHGSRHRHNNNNGEPRLKQCNKTVVLHSDAVPVFVLEYCYNMKEDKKERNMKRKKSLSVENVIKHTVSEKITDTHGIYDDEEIIVIDHIGFLSHNSLVSTPKKIPDNLYNKFDVTSKWMNLTNLNLSCSNISTFGNASQLISVTDLNVSCNYICDFIDLWTLFPNVINLNASFNSINTLTHKNLENIKLMKLNNLKVLNISWNQINRIYVVLKFLKKYTSSLRELDVSSNPVLDVHNVLHVEWFAVKYLSVLDILNGQSVAKPKSQLSSSTRLNQLQRASICKGAKNLVHSSCLSKMCYNEDNKMIGWEPHVGYNGDKMICLSFDGFGPCPLSVETIQTTKNLRYINLSSTGLDTVGCLTHLRYLVEANLSNNILTKIVSLTNSTNNLTVLNVSHNYFTCMEDIADSEMKNLKTLDISCNQLTSLIGIEQFPNLEELYASYNLLHNIDSIKPVKVASYLRAISLEYNLVEQCKSFRQLLLFNLLSLEFIDSIKIDEDEESTAIDALSGVIDCDYLLKEYKTIQASHLTKLTMPNCFIKDVNLNENCLVNVKVVEMENNCITNLKGFSTLPLLEVLNLSGNRISRLGITAYLEKVSDYKTNSSVVTNYTSMTPKEQGNSEENKISNSNESIWFNADTLFPSLKVLALNSNQITTLVPLKLFVFPKLSTLMLQDNELRNLKGLQGVKNLNNLILDKNKLCYCSTEDFEEARLNLTELFLECNGLRNIKFVRRLSNLKRLFLAQNRIQDTEELKYLKRLKLQELTMWGNAISRSLNYHSLVLEHSPDLKMFDGVLLQNTVDDKKSNKKKRELHSSSSNISCITTTVAE